MNPRLPFILSLLLLSGSRMVGAGTADPNMPIYGEKEISLGSKDVPPGYCKTVTGDGFEVWKKCPEQPCAHEWESGKYWITTIGSYEEPKYYPPSALMPVEVCKKCGILRIAPEKK